jgi:tRNA A37 methylthiotransferase MiaB
MMNRFYTVRDFRMIVETFRREIPDLSLSTDIICGFPGEDDEAFEDSLRLVEEVEPDAVNVSKFFPRPKTAASKMKQLPSQTVKARSRKMTEFYRKISLKRNKHWLDWTGEVFTNYVLAKHASNIVLIDKKGWVRYVTSGEVTIVARETLFKEIDKLLRD